MEPGKSKIAQSQGSQQAQGHEHSHSHDHDHDHDHDHEMSHLSDEDVRVRALESLLIEKGYIEREALDLLVQTYETEVGPHNGAQVVAKAWCEPAYKDWLLKDATAAIASLGFSGRGGEHMVVLENTPTVHNVVVCTLCSCYPWPVLGLPPVWYKSAPYRSRVVIDPRGVLAEFGCVLPDDVQIKVWDSNAELRYMVLPMRPAGTEHWNQDELAKIVTRDAMIGTGLVQATSNTSQD
jgi:nitrile hydratase